MGNADLLVLFVRINLKTEAERFFRCGIQFGREWQKVEVDEATAIRLQEEQMLEVLEIDPAAAAALDVPVASETPAAPVTADAPTAPVAPADPIERAAAVKSAILQLDTADSKLWTGGGAPTVAAIVAITGWDVSAIERDAVWAEIKAV
ncbi:hypothetical protein [Ferriphaselus sp. R-1]|uniref:hypothetical protein n=1 Tax=Ferriphaselus sp. R-1 TaxID=1485544 RepID=UPI000A7F2EF2|nr:hypothetical protein [Ferriphaselus sp. R-1]